MIYRILRTIIILASYIPLPAGRFLGRVLGSAAFLMPFERKTEAVENIQESFKDSFDVKASRELARKVYLHYGQMIFEVPHIMRMTRENFHKYLVFENEKHVKDALKKGKGVFGLTCHLGNWEYMSVAFPVRFGNISVVVRPIDFKPADMVVDEWRTRFGAGMINKQKGMRKILEAVKKNKIVGILLDQNVDWYEGAFVKFMGRRACTNKGLALMALKTGTPVVPIFCIRHPDGKYHIITEKEIDLIRTGDKIKDIEDNTALFTNIIEKYVRQYPDQWFWFHRRWKTRPYCAIPTQKN